MLKKWLSAYNFRYPRSIVYMLQASEYRARFYFRWLKKVKDFRNVEVRKNLVKTPKSILLLFIAWIIVLYIYGFSLFVLFSQSVPLNIRLFLFILIIALAPRILAYSIVIPLIIVKFLIQSPVECFIIRNARNKLKKHKGVKIAIAGSYGKTTMREILKTALSEGKKVSAPPENHNTLIGISNFIKTLKGDEEILIFEFGEYYKGDIKEMCELFHPDIGIITGVNEAHLERFEDLDTTARTIFELADWLTRYTGLPCVNPTQGSPVYLYINGENELAKKQAFKLKSDTNSAIAESVESGFIFYERNGINGIKISSAKTNFNGTSFIVEYKGATFEFKSQLLGLHQIGPLTVAIHLALRLGLEMSQIQKGISATKPFKHRLEAKTDASKVTILDDSYNGNPDGVKAVIDFLALLESRRRFYVTPGLVEMGYMTENVHREIGKRLAQAGIEKVVLIKNSVTPYIEKGLKESEYKGDIIWFEDGLSALRALPQLTAKGDVILLQNDWPDQYY